MKPITKKFTNLGNSIGIVIDKILLKESELENVTEIELVCSKGKITIRKPKEKTN